MTLAIAQELERDEATRQELPRSLLMTAVLGVNLAFALLPATIGLLVLVGLLR